MNKTYSMSIRVSEEKFEKFRRALRLEAYTSYSEFVKRTSLLETDKVLSPKEKGANYDNG